ncbi:MAG: hypothetical protein V4734_11935 [Terriglobus sp.]
MLDVHPPHESAHSVGDFFLHLFTITIGLLIAVGIEGAVTRHEHTKLANEARETMRDEIRRNESNAKDALKNIAEQRSEMEHNLAQLKRVQEGEKLTDPSLDASYGVKDFEHTAWRTAQATGALSYMPYDEANRFSSIYETLETFEKAEAVLAEDEAQFLGLIRRYSGEKHMSKESADALAERLGIWQGHLLNIHIAAMLLDDQQEAYLEGHEPSKHLSMSLHE